VNANVERSSEVVVLPSRAIVDKIKQYGWTVQDKPGEFALINKYNLEIDAAYQRQQLNSKVIGIAQKWSWIALNTITVAKRGDKYFVIDGGHRVMAARRRSDVHELPCMVFCVDDVVGEARGFLNINTARKAMTTTDRFNALLLIQDPAAVLVKELADEYGRQIGSDSSSGLRAIATCLRWAKLDGKMFRYMFPIISGASTVSGTSITEILVDGLMYIERCQPTFPVLSLPFWQNRIWSIGSTELCNQAKSAAAYYKRGGAKVWADGMLKALNKGVRENKRLKIEKEFDSIPE
jgi:hypothetical protein